MTLGTFLHESDEDLTPLAVKVMREMTTSRGQGTVVPLTIAECMLLDAMLVAKRRALNVRRNEMPPRDYEASMRDAETDIAKLRKARVELHRHVTEGTRADDAASADETAHGASETSEGPASNTGARWKRWLKKT